MVDDNDRLIALSREIEKANTELEQLTYQDGLTGIANRCKFDEALQCEWRRCQRYNQPLALIMIDIDYFKRYNDTYGHQSGDQCLHAVATAIKETLRRPVDLLARYGGEEFVCLLSDCDSRRRIQAKRYQFMLGR